MLGFIEEMQHLTVNGSKNLKISDFIFLRKCDRDDATFSPLCSRELPMILDNGINK